MKEKAERTVKKSEKTELEKYKEALILAGSLATSCEMLRTNAHLTNISLYADRMAEALTNYNSYIFEWSTQDTNRRKSDA